MNKQDEKALLTELLNQTGPNGSTWYGRKPLDIETEQEVRTILPELVKSVALINYIVYYTATDEEIYDVFQSSKLIETADTVARGVQITRRALSATDLDRMLREHIAVIIDLMKIEHFPKEDIDLLQDLGYRNPRAALAAVVQLGKTRRAELTDLITELGGPLEALEYAETQINEKKGWIGITVAAGPARRTRVGGGQRTPPTRRWFKGLGQVGAGTALALGNISLWVGGISGIFSPGIISPADTLMSVGGGVTALFLGLGDLRNE